MSSPFATPRQALAAMVAAGAAFTVRERKDSLGSSFTFRVAPGGDLDRCREIIADVKRRPVQFGTAFREAVRQHVREGTSR